MLHKQQEFYLMTWITEKERQPTWQSYKTDDLDKSAKHGMELVE